MSSRTCTPMAAVLMALVGSLSGAGPNPTLATLVREVRSEVSPEQAMEFMRRIYSTDRWFTFSKFQGTAGYLKRAMTQMGLKHVEIVNAPADGISQFGFWTMPMAWDVKRARLEIVAPAVPRDTAVLADYEKTPASLGMWSGATPPGGITAHVVELKESTPAEKLRGKLVLTSRNPADIKWMLAKAGALGAINAFSENPDLQDGRQWINAWGDNGWAFTKHSTPLLSFSITPRQAALLRKLLAEHSSFRVKAMVESRYYSGAYPYVTGIIPGSTSDEEVLTLGHTSEQGAQDNATGVAAMLESLATLNRLVRTSKLPRPKRTIRILAMGEMYGSLHYVASNPERVKRTVAAMCVDTPAAPYDLPGTEYTFYMNPHVASSYVDAFILRVAQEYFPKVGRPWHWKEFRTGTDTYLSEPMIGIPTTWAYSGTGIETHHNSEDTPDRVDARSLRDVAIINAVFLYYLANAGEAEARSLAEWSAARGFEQIRSQAPEKIAYRVDRETQAVLSVLRLVPANRRESLKGSLRPLLERLRSARSGAVLPSPPDGPASRIIVRRKRLGTIPLDEIPPDQREGYPSGAWASVPTIALYWCDGTRNLAEVIHLTEMELGPTRFDFVGYFEFLAKHGYVELVTGSALRPMPRGRWRLAFSLH